MFMYEPKSNEIDITLVYQIDFNKFNEFERLTEQWGGNLFSNNNFTEQIFEPRLSSFWVYPDQSFHIDN